MCVLGVEAGPDAELAGVLAELAVVRRSAIPIHTSRRQLRNLKRREFLRGRDNRYLFTDASVDADCGQTQLLRCIRQWMARHCPMLRGAS